jgi:Leucine-rich repeat (LRR) protein
MGDTLMKLTDINFEDEAFKACVLATGVENAEDITVLNCRKQKIKSAAGIEYLTNLKVLDLTRNELSELNLSKNMLLEEAFLGNNELSALDISGCTALTHLEVFINQLDELDVSNNPLLEAIYANKNDLEAIDLSQNKELVDLRLSGNELSDINLSVNDKLEKVELEKNPLSETAKSIVQQLEGAQVQL